MQHMDQGYERSYATRPPLCINVVTRSQHNAIADLGCTGLLEIGFSQCHLGPFIWASPPGWWPLVSVIPSTLSERLWHLDQGPTQTPSATKMQFQRNKNTFFTTPALLIRWQNSSIEQRNDDCNPFHQSVPILRADSGTPRLMCAPPHRIQTSAATRRMPNPPTRSRE